jgi:hypothetical protein
MHSANEDHTATYLVDTAVHAAQGTAQGNVFFINSVVTHVCFRLFSLKKV